MSDERVSILFANSTSVLGGAEQSLLAMLEGLPAIGGRGACVCPADGRFREEAERRGVPCFPAVFPRLRRTANPFRAAAMAARLAAARRAVRRAVAAAEPDIVHSNTTTAHLAAGPAARRAGKPAVWHVRDFTRYGLLGPRLVRWADKIIAISEAVAESVRPFAPQEKLVVIHNAIDADAFAARARPGRLRQELGLPADAPVILMAAQMAPWKNHRVFLEAAGRAAKRVPHLCALVAGEDLFGEHADYVRSLRRDAPACVRFLGQREDMPTVVADADVVVIPSRNEPFGRIALEAFALGKPVAASRSGGLPEIVEHEVCGLLCPEDSPAAFADAVCRLLEDASLRRAFGEAGRRRVRERFAVDAMMRRIEAVYEEVQRARGD